VHPKIQPCPATVLICGGAQIEPGSWQEELSPSGWLTFGSRGQRAGPVSKSRSPPLRSASLLPARERRFKPQGWAQE
jgi:hypothetical protein